MGGVDFDAPAALPETEGGPWDPRVYQSAVRSRLEMYISSMQVALKILTPGETA